jgi:hypothetical protein
MQVLELQQVDMVQTTVASAFQPALQYNAKKLRALNRVPKASFRDN